jgi:LuxR family maltose regulon positive regulatory protein
MYTDPQSKNIAWRETDAAACVFARLQIRNNEFDTAIATISHFHQHAISLGSVRSQLRYELLYSLAYRGKGDMRSSLEHLSQALSLSRQSGFLRSFLDEGDELADILSILVDRVETGADARDNVDRAKEILRGFSGACSQDEHPSLLSSRELEVMQQLVHGSSNKIIAKKIDISENTVRFHLKNIFAKLHVKNRLQAVSEARKQNLIP